MWENIWTPLWTSGAIPWVSTRFSRSVENEQADTKRDSQICLTKPNPQACTGTRKFFPVQLTMDRIGKLTLNSRLLSGHLGFVAGTLRGSLSPSAMVRWVCNSRDPVLCAQGTLTSQCGHNCLISYWYTAANVARFFFIRVFKEVI